MWLKELDQRMIAVNEPLIYCCHSHARALGVARTG
jgi:hypothetical protein